MSKDTPRNDGGRWAKGQSGNPAGRPRQDAQVRELARAHTEKSLETLAHIRDESKNDLARVRAAESLLNRAWGQPTAYVETASSLADEMDRIKRRAASHDGAVVPLFPAETQQSSEAADDEDATQSEIP